jgi:thiaminase (transcriptional activator TenA)
VTRFFEEASSRTATLRAKIAELPFLKELCAGTLSRERFQGYIIADALYLREFSRALALAAAKAPDPATSEFFAGSALGAVAVERALHERTLEEFGIGAKALESAEASPDGLAYTSFLLATAYSEPFAVVVAALLPCFSIYWDVGGAIKRQAQPQNPYRAWIETYADPRFGSSVERVIAIAEREAAVAPSLRERMLGAFTQAARYEWLFWDGAYRRRGWPEDL